MQTTPALTASDAAALVQDPGAPLLDRTSDAPAEARAARSLAPGEWLRVQGAEPGAECCGMVRASWLSQYGLDLESYAAATTTIRAPVGGMAQFCDGGAPGSIVEDTYAAILGFCGTTGARDALEAWTHVAIAQVDARDKTCAVVGSSNVLSGAGHGAAIDAHDVVVRMNEAPTATFEEDVGARTDVRFVGLARECNIVELLYREATRDETSTLVVHPTELALAFHLVNATFGAFGARLKPRLARRLAVMRPSFCGHVARRWMNAYSDDLTRAHSENVQPSTGLLATAFAAHAGCAAVDLYGFGWSHGAGPRWYYDRAATCPSKASYKTTKNGGAVEPLPYWFPDHDFDFETRLLRDLADHGVIRMY